MNIYYVVLDNRGKARFVQEHNFEEEKQPSEEALDENSRARLDKVSFDKFVDGRSIQWLQGEKGMTAFSALLPATGAPLKSGWITLFVQANWLFEALNQAQAVWWHIDAYQLAQSHKVSGQYRMVSLNQLINGPRDDSWPREAVLASKALISGKVPKFEPTFRTVKKTARFK